MYYELQVTEIHAHTHIMPSIMIFGNDPPSECILKSLNIR